MPPAIQTLGTATVQIATALNKFSEAIADIGSSAALTTLSTVVMTGNVVGAVMTLMPLLVDQGPSPDELILSEISKLRTDVNNLHRDMGRHFDSVDKTLNLIYGVTEPAVGDG